jgi:hypothetical protein
MRHLVLCVCTLASCFSSVRVHAQDTSRLKAVLHVTAVQAQDDPAGYCETAGCSAKKFTVEGYVTAAEGMSTKYVLSCVEALPRDLMARYAACARVHANKNYSVTIAPDWVDFDTHEPYSTVERPNYILQAHTIVSEREER